MTLHDASPEYFGLIQAEEIPHFQLDETQLIPSNEDEPPSDLIIGYMRHRMHGESAIAHIHGLPDTGDLLLSRHQTATSEVYSVRYRLHLAREPQRHEATSIIIPHNTDMPRLGEMHSYRFARDELAESIPSPISERQYQVLRHIGYTASKVQTLRIAS